MSYKEPIYDYRAKDGLDPDNPKKKVMGYELMAEFEAIARELTEVEGDLDDHWVEKTGDVMTGTLDTPKLVAVDILAGEINADEIHAVTFHGNGEEITDIITDQLKDVNSENASRDDVLVFNGTLWEATDFALIDTALTFKGGIDLTNSAEYPGLLTDGDLYIANADGVVAAEWVGIAGTAVNAGNFVGWAESKLRWYLLGDLSSAAVTRVVAGLGIDVDDSVPAEPVVSIDRTEVDTWYADLAEFNDLKLDVEGNTNSIEQNALEIEKNAADIAINKGDIANNAGDISANAGNIANLEANVGNINIGDLADKNHNHDGVYLKAETDPTVPAHVKSISTADIAKWNTPAPAGGAVDSVNGKTGVVVLSHTDVGAAAASHTHAYAPTSHTHSEYSPTSHNHNGVYQPAGSYAAASHNHSGVYAPASHTHTQYLTSFTETDPTVPAHVKGISTADIAKWNTPVAAGGQWTDTSTGIATLKETVEITQPSNSWSGGKEKAALTITAFYQPTDSDPPNLLLKSTDTAKIGFLDTSSGNKEGMYLGGNTNSGDHFLHVTGGRSNLTGKVSFGGNWLYANGSWLENIRINGTYYGTNVTFRDSAGVTASDLIDVFKALKTATESISNSDPVAAVASMKSAFLDTSESLIAKFQALHDATRDERKEYKLAQMEAPEGVDATRPPKQEG